MANEPDRSPRTRSVSPRLTGDEYARWETAAKAAGREKVAQWAREVITQVLDEQDGNETNAGPYLTTSLAAIRYQGRNLNRIARALEELVESGQLVDKAALETFERAILDTAPPQT